MCVVNVCLPVQKHHRGFVEASAAPSMSISSLRVGSNLFLLDETLQYFRDGAGTEG